MIYLLYCCFACVFVTLSYSMTFCSHCNFQPLLLWSAHQTWTNESLLAFFQRRADYRWMNVRIYFLLPAIYLMNEKMEVAPVRTIFGQVTWHNRRSMRQASENLRLQSAKAIEPSNAFESPSPIEIVPFASQLVSESRSGNRRSSDTCTASLFVCAIPIGRSSCSRRGCSERQNMGESMNLRLLELVRELEKSS